MARRLLFTLVAGGTLAVLSACGVGTLSSDQVAETAEDALEGEVGTRPDIECPDALDKEEGASTRCTLTAGDDPTTYGVTVTVTSTDGDTKLGVTVDDEPQDD
ncbi:DUF4333 domain-containing protein [Blastococcus sp. TML/M2B]|uniref:DUF4333 domain-containing protein n=1 Tax=unclassified Blastococcus TaxID=2619396 RepID=UPI00190C1092|nr:MULTISPECIES: DUF4333 domain-containing protein [unclassified Blastococcus]MBN1091123.1 DUF4333 domain-containing protein [Blastococcus sp. TML/M2B]MBN1094364.1 DUF4333 domain-containing protein [Blastococcus sp. TML/M2B]MBN1095324.1 DUF4333 domain-containing protein [Blastococcus sp. TML/C7B]